MFILIERLAAGDVLPLAGVPFAVKDNIDLAGLDTTAACPAFAYRPAASATVVDRLLAAGAIPVGKTNLDQFATGLTGTRSAYGIPQALPGSKMASAGADWQTNPETQIKWGHAYMKDRYGSPCGAWSHWQANGWY